MIEIEKKLPSYVLRTTRPSWVSEIAGLSSVMPLMPE